jgi:hypothetical protein
MPKPTDIKSILIIGAVAIVTGDVGQLVVG